MERKSNPPRTPRGPSATECLRADMEREEALEALDKARAKLEHISKIADDLVAKTKSKTSGEHRIHIDMTKLRPAAT